MEMENPLPPVSGPELGPASPPMEERYRLLVESIRDYAIMLLDPDGRVVSWNSGAQSINGYTADEIIGQHFSVFYPQDAIDRRWPAIELQVAAREGRFEDEGWRLRKDGTRFWANAILTALRNDAGELIGFAKITRDLTERRDNEERVRQSEERFRLLIESVQDSAFYMLDPSGTVVSWNRGAERITGYTAAEIIGQHFSRFFPDHDIADQKPERELREALRIGRCEHEAWRVRKDGSRFWAYVVLSALYDSTGHHRGFAKVTRDLTQRRQVEELEESNRRINEFLAMLAHELRNPLAPIRNAVTVMQRVETQDATSIWARDVIDRQSTHLARLVDDLLDISRITTGKINLRRETLDINEIVSRAVEAARPVIDNRHHELTIVSPREKLIVDGDPTRLAQVLVNLLNNAAKYTPEGGRITLTIQRDQDDIAVSVRDTGVGIPKHLLPRVFELFTQGDRSLARSEGGLGIGLTLAQRLVQMHGGSIDATSEGANRGTEFIVRLPLARIPSATAPASDEDEALRPGACRVLVVDDNRDSAETMTMLLTLNGHKARMAYDGPSAIDMALRFQPHVILLDIGLPGMDGYEVAAALRARPEMATVVLVAMTGYGLEEDRRKSEGAGFAHHLVKPVDPAELERVIASAACEG
jgi:PAS domain S-box-containing protein